MNASSLLTRPRILLERDAGLSNLELPASLLCSSHPFRLFLLSILVDLPRFRDVYNQSLALHRQVHHLRGSANPLPDLAPDEAPFWIYASGSERLPLRVRDDGQSLSLLHDGLPFFTLSPSELADLRAGRPHAFDAASRRLAHASPHLRIRTRALTTTLFLRLFVADVFIHGVGGAKYDSVTDEIIRRYYHVEPPVFITASATLLLPLETFPGSPEDLIKLRRLLRDLHSNPDRHLPPDLLRRPDVSTLLRRKHELIASHADTPHARREIFESLHAVNRDLAQLLADRRLSVQAELDLTSRHVAFNRILASREHPFLLFPRSFLLDFYHQALAGITGT